MAWLREAAKKPKVVAIGEIGLDYHWPEPARDVQQKWFAAQLELARELDLPVIIHSRDAAQDTYDMLREAGGDALSCVIHCFSYEKEMAARFLDLGYCLGIGGVVTYKNARKLKEVAAYMPPERMLLETDCPYLSPIPHRGERNEPSYAALTLAKIAELKGVSFEEADLQTTRNAREFFGIE